MSNGYGLTFNIISDEIISVLSEITHHFQPDFCWVYKFEPPSHHGICWQVLTKHQEDWKPPHINMDVKIFFDHNDLPQGLNEDEVRSKARLELKSYYHSFNEYGPELASRLQNVTHLPVKWIPCCV